MRAARDRAQQRQAVLDVAAQLFVELEPDFGEEAALRSQDVALDVGQQAELRTGLIPIEELLPPHDRGPERGFGARYPRIPREAGAGDPLAVTKQETRYIRGRAC